jgi:hypothetical protein
MRSVRLLQADGFVSIRDEAEIGEAASLVSIFLGAGGMGSRIDGALTLTGKGAFAEMGGALLTSGTQKQEAAVAVRHEAIEGTSRQLWRAVAANRSTVSLAARVEVARGAQQTDGEQSLRGLLLERTATVNLKPELEIFADDVKCAHGATVGELDKRALFYLQSRGIPSRAPRRCSPAPSSPTRCRGSARSGARGVRRRMPTNGWSGAVTLLQTPFATPYVPLMFYAMPLRVPHGKRGGGRGQSEMICPDSLQFTPLRHAELVSASKVQPAMASPAEGWTLKQVQGDGI